MSLDFHTAGCGNVKCTAVMWLDQEIPHQDSTTASWGSSSFQETQWRLRTQETLSYQVVIAFPVSSSPITQMSSVLQDSQPAFQFALWITPGMPQGLYSFPPAPPSLYCCHPSKPNHSCSSNWGCLMPISYPKSQAETTSACLWSQILEKRSLSTPHTVSVCLPQEPLVGFS